MDPNNQQPQEPTATPQPQTITPSAQPSQTVAPVQPVIQPQQATAPPVIAINPQQSTTTMVENKKPGKVLAIISLILAFLGLSLIGLILAIVAKIKSRRAGLKNNLAVVSMVINSLFILITVGIVTSLYLAIMPAIHARAVTNAFTVSIIAGDYDSALSYTTDPGKEVDTTKAYLTHIRNEIGNSQEEVSTASQDGYYGFVYTTNGASKYYRVIVKDGKVYDASINASKLSPLGSNNAITQ